MPLVETQTPAHNSRREKGKRDAEATTQPPHSLRRSAMAVSKAKGKILRSALKTISLTTQWQK